MNTFTNSQLQFDNSKFAFLPQRTPCGYSLSQHSIDTMNYLNESNHQKDLVSAPHSQALHPNQIHGSDLTWWIRNRFWRSLDNTCSVIDNTLEHQLRISQEINSQLPCAHNYEDQELNQCSCSYSSRGHFRKPFVPNPRVPCVLDHYSLNQCFEPQKVRDSERSIAQEKRDRRAIIRGVADRGGRFSSTNQDSKRQHKKKELSLDLRGSSTLHCHHQDQRLYPLQKAY